MNDVTETVTSLEPRVGDRPPARPPACPPVHPPRRHCRSPLLTVSQSFSIHSLGFAPPFIRASFWVSIRTSPVFQMPPATGFLRFSLGFFLAATHRVTHSIHDANCQYLALDSVVSSRFIQHQVSRRVGLEPHGASWSLLEPVGACWSLWAVWGPFPRPLILFSAIFRRNNVQRIDLLA